MSMYFFLNVDMGHSTAPEGIVLSHQAVKDRQHHSKEGKRAEGNFNLD